MSTPTDRNAIPSASAAVPTTDPPTLAPANDSTMGHPRPPMAPLSGDAIEVPGYVIEGELGRGGMGVVYKATNVLMNRSEVLKVVNKSLLDGHSGSAERFLREIQAAARLDHENVVKAHSVLRVGELLVFAMEYVEGEDLAKLVRRQGPLPVINACHYISQAAMGLQHAHERGMVHRDIKPHNLILTRRGKRHVVKILDFGLAKAVRGEETVDYLTAAGAMLGTPAFMAPEQATDAANADIRTDIYSLGCTLYHLLTGAPPFAGKTYFAVLKAHESATAPSLMQLRADVPPELAAAAAKMLAKNPAERFQKPIDVAKALAPIIKHPAPSPKEQSPKVAVLLPAGLAGLPTALPVHEKTAAQPPRRQSEIEKIVPSSPRKAASVPTKTGKPANPKAPRRRSSVGTGRMVLGGLAGFLILSTLCWGAAYLLTGWDTNTSTWPNPQFNGGAQGIQGGGGHDDASPLPNSGSDGGVNDDNPPFPNPLAGVDGIGDVPPFPNPPPGVDGIGDAPPATNPPPDGGNDNTPP